MEKNIIRNKRSTQVNRLSDNCFIVVVIPIHFSNYTSSPTSIHCMSNDEFEVAIFRIGLVESCSVSKAKNNLLPFPKFDSRRDLIGTDFAEEVFPLLKY